MEITYYLAKLITKDVLVKSEDYYARKGDSSEESVQVLEIVETFKTNEEALDRLKEFKKRVDENSSLTKYIKGDYTILPIYSI